jgi:hypothetical protein
MRLPTTERENERMNLLPSLPLRAERPHGMFNLNDPRWGRGEDKNDDKRPEGNKGPNQGRPTSTNCGATSIASSAACSGARAASRHCAAAAMAMAVAAASSPT